MPTALPPFQQEHDRRDPLAPQPAPGATRRWVGGRATTLSLWRHLLYDDRLLLLAILICALVLSYQLGVTVLRPSWSGPVTDGLRVALAWPALLTVGCVSLWLTRANAPDARFWLMCSGALLSYAIARTFWSIDNQFMFRHGVPFPTVADLFFVLQYPFFLLAAIFIPYKRLRVSRLLLILDSLLWIGAVTVLLGTLLLVPAYTAGGMSSLARSILLLYQLGDLFILCTLALTLLRSRRYRADRIVVGVLIFAFTCLIVADTWVGVILDAPGNVRHVYRTGGPPDLFWVAFYLILPLASLLRLRLAQREPAWNEDLAPAGSQYRLQLRWDDVKASLRFALPLAAALLVSGLILVRVIIAMEPVDQEQLLMPLVVSLGLLLLVIVRQALTYLENARLRREREAAHAAALVLQQTTEHMDDFIATAAHDLRTPIGAMVGYIDLAGRKCERLDSTAREGSRAEVLEQTRGLQGYLDHASEGATRTIAVVNRILATAQGRTGEFEMHPTLCDLSEVVLGHVNDLRMANPRRTIRLEVPGDTPVPVRADAGRIGEVVTNYLTNALKYSAEDEPVEVRVTPEGSMARVAVSDHGPGLPSGELAHVWDRFYRVPGVIVRSGTNIGLGLGLYICKLIVERHGGQVGVESVPGTGSTFWFTLPLAEKSPTRPVAGEDA
jgi:signal transduction histidine kinase